jgi:hypothetical protein
MCAQGDALDACRVNMACAGGVSCRRRGIRRHGIRYGGDALTPCVLTDSFGRKLVPVHRQRDREGLRFHFVNAADQFEEAERACAGAGRDASVPPSALAWSIG